MSKRDELIHQVEEVRESMVSSVESIDSLTYAVREAQSESSASSQELARAIQAAVKNYLVACERKCEATENAASHIEDGLVAAASILRSIESDREHTPVLRQFFAEQNPIFASQNGRSFRLAKLKSMVRYTARIRGQDLEELIQDWLVLGFIVPVSGRKGKSKLFRVNKNSGVYLEHIKMPKKVNWIKVKGYETLEAFYEAHEQRANEGLAKQNG